MSVNSDFFQIRKTNKSSRPLLYIKASGTDTVRNDANVGSRPSFDIDLNAAIYPKLKAW